MGRSPPPRATIKAYPTPHHPPSPLRHLLVFSYVDAYWWAFMVARGGDGHAHHTTNSGETDSPYPCFFNNLRRNPDTGLDLLGSGTTIRKAQVMLPFGRIDKKPFTYRHQYTFLLCKTLYILSKDMLRQTEPDEKATSWSCPLRIKWHILAQSC